MLVRLYTLTPEKVLDITSSLSWIKGTTGLIADNDDERYKQVIQALDKIKEELSKDCRYRQVNPDYLV